MNNLKWLEELAKTPILTNRNYIETIKNIPEYFETNDSLWCMMLAFRLGELRGRECEADKIKWNALAIFQSMKIFYDFNGNLPSTQQELREWQDNRLKSLEAGA